MQALESRLTGPKLGPGNPSVRTAAPVNPANPSAAGFSQLARSIWVEHPNQVMVNVGDLAMLMMDVERLRALFPEAIIHVPARHADWVSRFCPAATRVSASGLYQLAWRQLAPQSLGRILRLDALERRWLLFNAHRYLRIVAWRNRLRRQADPQSEPELSLLGQSDLVLAAGGGYLNDAFASSALRCTKVLLVAQSLGIPTALFGQGLGPLERADTRQLIGTMLRRAHLIGLREGVLGPSLAGELDLPPDRRVITGDSALDLTARLRTDQPGDHLGFNIRVADYARTSGSDLAGIGQAIARFARSKGVSIMPCPIFFGHQTPDEPAARSLVGSSATVFADPCPFHPLEVIRRVGRCRVVVTGSYHAAVFALGQGIPVVGLAASKYYTAKFAGLAGLFGAAMTVVELDRPDASDALVWRMDEAWSAAPHLRDDCLRASDQQREETRMAWSYLPGLVATRR